MILVSACLIGVCCRYDGNHQRREEIVQLVKEGKAMAVCPEQLGGLPTPRPPAEKVGEKILTKSGDDLSKAYQKGAQEAMIICEISGCTEAFLKSRSPMCGHKKIYNGSFSDSLTDGEGVLTELLLKRGIKVTSVD